MVVAPSQPPVWCLLSDRAVLAIDGADRAVFLQGLISNDVGRLKPERAIYAALLSAQGKYQADFLLWTDGRVILADVEASRAAWLQQRLVMYRLRAQVTIEPRPSLAVAAVLPPLPAELGLGTSRGDAGITPVGPGSVDPRLAALGARIFADANGREGLAAWLGAAADADVYEAHRLALGVPNGTRDLEPDKALLLECGFVELDGVAFDKGCFVGQELTARMRYRASVRKRLLPVRLSAEAKPGTSVRDGGVAVGELRSVRGATGLAVVRLDRWERARQAGRPLQAGPAVVEPWIPDWVDPSFAVRTPESSA